VCVSFLLFVFTKLLQKHQSAVGHSLATISQIPHRKFSTIMSTVRCNPDRRCKSKTGRHNQDQSRCATNHRRIV